MSTATAQDSGAAPRRELVSQAMAEPDLGYSDTEDALRSAVRRLFAERLSVTALNAATDLPAPDFSGVWQTLTAELGVAGLLIPENLGGAGATEREAAVVCEEIGRAVAPAPFLSSAVIATDVLLHAGALDTVRRLADGESTAALVVSFAATPDSAIGAITDSGGSLTGTVTSVAGALEADMLIVVAQGSDGSRLHVVAADAPGVRIEAIAAFDMTRPLADVTLTSVVGTAVETDAETAVNSALQTGYAMLASEQVGIAQWCLETTLAYVKERTQFGRKIGSYQAIKHRLADLWLDVSSASAAARYAADTAARGESDAAIAAHVAAAYCSEVAVRAAEECVQLHGGIGMTWEYPAHLYLKRAKADQIALGSGFWHRARLAELVDLAPA